MPLWTGLDGLGLTGTEWTWLCWAMLGLRWVGRTERVELGWTEELEAGTYWTGLGYAGLHQVSGGTMQRQTKRATLYQHRLLLPCLLLPPTAHFPQFLL